MPKLKRLSLEIDYYFNSDLDMLLQNFSSRRDLNDGLLIKRQTRSGPITLKLSKKHPVPFIEPRIVIEDGKEVHYYKSNM